MHRCSNRGRTRCPTDSDSRSTRHERSCTSCVSRPGRRNRPSTFVDARLSRGPPDRPHGPLGYLRPRRRTYDDNDLQRWAETVKARGWERAFVFSSTKTMGRALKCREGSRRSRRQSTMRSGSLGGATQRSSIASKAGWTTLGSAGSIERFVATDATILVTHDRPGSLLWSVDDLS